MNLDLELDHFRISVVEGLLTVGCLVGDQRCKWSYVALWLWHIVTSRLHIIRQLIRGVTNYD